MIFTKYKKVDDCIDLGNYLKAIHVYKQFLQIELDSDDRRKFTNKKITFGNYCRQMIVTKYNYWNISLAISKIGLC